jgi:hypothetical protein
MISTSQTVIRNLQNIFPLNNQEMSTLRLFVGSNDLEILANFELTQFSRILLDP